MKDYCCRRLWKRVLVIILTFSMTFSNCAPSILSSVGRAYASELPAEEESSVKLQNMGDDVTADESAGNGEVKIQEDESENPDVSGESEDIKHGQSEESDTENLRGEISGETGEISGETGDDSRWNPVGIGFAEDILQTTVDELDDFAFPGILVLETEKKKTDSGESQGDSIKTEEIEIDMTEGVSGAYRFYIAEEDPETFDKTYTELEWIFDCSPKEVLQNAEAMYREEHGESADGFSFAAIPDFNMLKLNDSKRALLEAWFEEQGYESADDYFLNNAFISIGKAMPMRAMKLGALNSSEVEITLNYTEDVPGVYFNDYSNHRLTIKQSGRYRLIVQSGMGSVNSLEILFEGNLDNVVLNLDNVSVTAKSGTSVIDFTGVDEAELIYTGTVSLNGAAGYSVINLPAGSSLIVTAANEESELGMDTPKNAAGIGVTSGHTPGSLTFGPGNVLIESYKSNTVAFGSTDPEDPAMQVTIAGEGESDISKLCIDNAGSDDLFPLQSVNMSINSYGELILFDDSLEGPGDGLAFDDGNHIFYGRFAEVLPATDITVTGSEWSKELELSNQTRAFMINVPAKDSYTLTGKDSYGHSLKYKGIMDGDSSYTTSYAVDGYTKFNSIEDILSPVFWKDYVQEGSVTFSSAVLWGEVDTIKGQDHSISGDQNINEMGFVVYKKNAEGEWENAFDSLYVPATYVDHTDAAATGGGVYKVELTGLVSGTDYKAKPYVKTTAETFISDEVNITNLEGEDSTLYFTTPDVEYPESLSLTYGTAVAGALSCSIFDVDDSKKAVVDGVTVQFHEGDETFGANIDGHYELYSDEQCNVDVSEIFIPATETDESPEAYQIYYCKFIPDNQAYSISSQPVEVYVDRKTVSVTDIQDADGDKTKVYDGTADVTDGQVILSGIVEQDGVPDALGAGYESCTYNSKNVSEAQTITLTGITLTGEPDVVKNYKLSETEKTINEASITGRPVTLKPYSLTKWAGETFTPLTMDVAGGSLAEGDVVNGDVVPEYNTAYSSAIDTGYFVNVPEPGQEIGAKEGTTFQTVSLNTDKLNNDAVCGNYTISTETEDFRFDSEYPVKDVNYKYNVQPNNGWFNSDVVITPVGDDLPDGSYENGYDKIRQMRAPDSTDAVTSWTDSYTVSETTDSLYLRLKNNSTGAYTWVNQAPVSIRIDKTAPSAAIQSFKKKSDSSIISNFLAKLLGNFYNDTVTVTMSFTEDSSVGETATSGLDYFRYSLDGGNTYTEIDLGNTEAVTVSKNDGFDIPVKQNGNVVIEVYDIAGNCLPCDICVDDAANNLWIIEQTKPEVLSVKAYETGTDTEAAPVSYEGANWYPTAIDVCAVVVDNVGSGEAAAGLYSVEWKENDGDGITIRDEFEDAIVTEQRQVFIKSYTADSTLDGPSYTVSVKATDNAGNESNSSQNSVISNIKIDASAPVVSELTQTPSSYTKENVTISFTASDAQSGIKSISWAYSADDISYGAEHIFADIDARSFTPGQGENINGWYRLTVTDNVGHFTVKKIHVTSIDRLNPMISSLEITDPEGTPEWYSQNVRITVTAEDDKTASDTSAESGIVSYTCTYTKDGIQAEPITYNWTEDKEPMVFSLTETGIYDISVYVTDAAGNSSESSVIENIQIDKTSPSIDVTAVNNASNDDDWTNQDVTFKLSNTASMHDGNDVTYYVVIGNDEYEVGSYAGAHDNAVWNNATNTLTFVDDCNLNIKFKAAAESGLSSVSDEYLVRYTKSVPDVPVYTSVPDYVSGTWYNASNLPYVTFSASGKKGEDLADVTTQIKWEKEGQAAQQTEITSGTRTIDFGNEPAQGNIGLGDGIWTVSYKAYDEAGNENAGEPLVYRVDRTAPAADTGNITYQKFENDSWIEWILNKLDFGVFWKTKIRVNVPVADEVSGVAKIEYSTDNGGTWTDIDTIEDGIASFDIPLETNGVVCFTVTDNAGNTCDRINLAAENGIIWLLENYAPIISEYTYTGSDGNTVTPQLSADGIYWYTEPVTVNVQITDNIDPEGQERLYSGISKVEYSFGTKSDTKTYSGATGNADISETIDDEGEGIELNISAEDNATNRTEKDTKTINVDFHAPALVLNERGKADNVFTKDDFNLVFSVTDTASLVRNISVETWINESKTETTDFVTDGASAEGATVVDGGFLITYQVSHNGTYKLIAEDWAGNKSEISETVTNVDKKAPSISEFNITDENIDPDIWQHSAVPLTFSAEDTLSDDAWYSASGIRKYYLMYRTHGTQDEWAYTNQSIETDAGTVTDLSANKNGWNDYLLAVEDNVGNTAYSSDFITLKLDTGEPNLWNWAYDSVHGLDEEWEGPEGSWINGEAYLKMCTDLDEAQVPHSFYISEDGGETYTIASDDKYDGMWTRIDDEARSGVPRVVYQLKVSEEGIHKYKFKLEKDETQLSTESGEYTVKIDKTNPQDPSYSVVSYSQKVGDWYSGENKPVLKLIETADSQEGPDKSALNSEYRLYKDTRGDAESFTGNKEVSISSDGIWNLELVTYDGSEYEPGEYNKSATVSETIKVDTTAPYFVGKPEIKVTEENKILQFFTFGNYGNSALEVTLTVKDDTSGPESMSYYISDDCKGDADCSGEGNEKTFKFTIPLDIADSQIKLTIADIAGNKKEAYLSSDTSDKWTLETESPSVDIEVENELPEGSWYNIDNPLKVTGKASDSSGLASVEYVKTVGETETIVSSYSIPDNPDKAETEFNKEYSFSTEGADDEECVKFTVRAKDIAGNVVTPDYTKTFKLDTVAPSISVTGGNPAAWQKNEAVISFSWSDQTSGIALDTLTVVNETTNTLVPAEDISKTKTGGTFKAGVNGTYKLTVKDVAGNTGTDSVTVEKIDPLIPDSPSISVKVDGTDVTENVYYSKKPVIKVTVPAKNTVSAMYTKYELRNNDTGAAVDETFQSQEAAQEKDISSKITNAINDDGTWTLTVTTWNEAGTYAENSCTQTFSFDRYKPFAAGYNYEKVEPSQTEKFFNKLTFGVFFKEQAKVVFAVKDAGEDDSKPFSGAAKLNYAVFGEKQNNLSQINLNETVDVSDNKASVKIQVEEKVYLYYSIEDKAGNTTDTAEFSDDGTALLMLDLTKPVISDIAVTESESGTQDYLPNEDGWYNTDIWIKSSVEDPASNGVAGGLNEVKWNSTELFSDPASVQTAYDVNKKVSTEGTITVKLTAKDNALNEAESKSVTVKIDKTAPTLVLNNDPLELTTPRANPLELDLTVTDSISHAVNHEDYIYVHRIKNAAGETIDDIPDLTVTSIEEDEDKSPSGKETAKGYNIKFTAEENGVYKVYVKDLAGNSTATDYYLEVTGIDDSEWASPEITVDGNPVSSSKWYKKTEGQYPVIKVINNEPEKSDVFFAFADSFDDEDKPTEWTDTEHDKDTGVSTVDPVITSDGELFLWLYMKRNTQEESPFYKQKILVDSTKPQIVDISIKNEDETDGSSVWTNKPQTVIFDIDNVPGTGASKNSDIKSVTVVKGEEKEAVEVTRVEGETAKYSFTASENDVYTVEVTDEAENANTKDVTINHIDMDEPAVPVVDVTDITQTGDWTSTAPTVKITKVVEEGAAPVTTWYSFKLEEGDEQVGFVSTSDSSYSRKLADGIWSWKAWSTDEAGNKSEETSGTARVDTMAPVLTGASVKATGQDPLSKIGRMLGFGNFFKEKLEVTITVTDDQTDLTVSGNNKLYYTIGSGEEAGIDIKSGKAVFSIPVETVGRIAIAADDKCGHRSELKYLIKNETGTDGNLGADGELWVIDSTAPEISGFGKSSESADNGWYNTNVTFRADAEDKSSGINHVAWTIKTNENDEETGEEKFYGELDSITEKVTGFEQVVSADGQTIVDFMAENNATGLSVLSDSVEEGARTVKIDKTKPYIEYQSGNPDSWKDEAQTIVFSVTDDPAEGALVHSGVDDNSVTVTRIREGQQNEQPEVKWIRNEDNCHIYSFVADGNAVYKINASDIAGNKAAELEVTVTKIDGSVPGTPKSNPAAEGDKKDGYASFTKAEYYTSCPEIMLTGSVNFIIGQGIKDTAPVTTYYRMYLEGDKSPDTYFIDNEEQPKTVSVDAGEKIDARDGKWILEVWNITASGVKSEETLTETFFIDRKKPEITAEPVSVEVRNEGSVYEFINRLSFGVFFNKELEVTVQIEDEASHGSKLYYYFGEDSAETDIVLDNDNPSMGIAVVILPVNKSGEVVMTAEDNAGNFSDITSLAVDGTTFWKLEDKAPELDPDKSYPANASLDVSVENTDAIKFTFNEYVKPNEGGKIKINSGSEVYYALFPDNDIESIGITTGPEGETAEGIGEPGQEDKENRPWEVTVPISAFKNASGKRLYLAYDTAYVVTVMNGAFSDIACNTNSSALASAFVTEDGSERPEPVIKTGKFSIGLPEDFAVMKPEEFNQDTHEYHIAILDGAMNDDNLIKPLPISLELDPGVVLGTVKLVDMEGHVSWTLTEEKTVIEDRNYSFEIPEDQIKTDEKCILSIEINSAGKSSTYSFFIIPNCISIVEDAKSGVSGQAVAETDMPTLAEMFMDELIERSMTENKVVLTFKARALSPDSVQTETQEAISMERDKNYGEPVIYNAYPIDIGIEILSGRTGRSTKVRELPDNKKIVVGIRIPSYIRGSIKGLYRYHNGRTEEIPLILNSDKTMGYFTSGKYSVYSIVYTMPKSSGGNGGGGGGGGNGGGSLSSGKWYQDGYLFVDNYGRRPENQWIRVNGKVYYVGSNGFRTSKQGYSFASDGSVIGTVNEKITDMNGTWLNDGWRFVTNEGKQLIGWNYLLYEGKYDWYYFNAQGWMLDGWFINNGNTYYLHTVHDRTRGHMYTGWNQIGGKMYYFRTKPEGMEGALLRNGYTPDGYFIRADGTWDGRSPVKLASR